MSKLRQQILSIKDIKTEVISVPDWDCDLEIIGLTGAERAAIIEQATVRTKDEEGNATTYQDSSVLYPLLIIASVQDPETHEKVFGERDRDAINAKSAGVLEDVAMACCKLSGITPDAVKVIRKNSETTPSADSSSVWSNSLAG